MTLGGQKSHYSWLKSAPNPTICRVDGFGWRTNRRLGDVGGSLTVVCITTMARRRSAARATSMLARQHPEALVRTMVVDDLIDDDGARFIGSLFAPREFARLAMLHEGPALVASVRPVVLRALADQGAGSIIVLPDDAEVFQRLDSMVEHVASDGAIVVLQNRFGPPPADGQLPDSVDAALRGRHDQDLLALRCGDVRTAEFLDAWCACLRRSPHIPVSRLDPMTYPWLDSLSERRGVVSIVDASMPLSVRNADESARAGTPTLVRWPAFNPETPWILSAETGTLPRVRPSSAPRLASLARDRASQLTGAPDDGRVGAFEQLPDGHVVDAVIRRAYANAVVRFESGNADEPPNPFAGDDTARFFHWLASPGDHGPAPFVEAFREVHDELHDALPTNEDLIAWLSDRGAVAGIAPVFRARKRQPASVMRELGPGIEISGYLGAAFGMGEAARALVAGARNAGIAHSTIVDPRSTYHRDDSEADAPDPHEPTDATPSTLVVVRNADALLADPTDVIAARADGQRVVGYWFWEVATFPDRLRPALELVDEIWVATEFVADALRPVTSLPVRLLPYVLPTPMEASERTRLRDTFARAHTIEDDRFVVSFSFDYDSVADRKNPWGVVEAYRMAFPKEGEPLEDGRVPLLILKAIGAQRHPTDHDRLLYATGDRGDVRLIEEHLDSELQRGLFARSDAYVSLHRGEGLGLTLAEAMAAGCPVVCTGYGGNLSFCTENTVLFVPFELIDIPPATPVYAGCGSWANPSIQAAAAHLRSLVDQPSLAATMVHHAATHLRNLHVERMAALTTFLTERAAYGDRHQQEEDVMSNASNEVGEVPPFAPSPASHPGLGPVVLPGASAVARPGGSGMREAVADRVRSTVEPMLVAQAAFEQTRVVALVDAVQQTRQAVLDIEANARAERETLTEAITGASDHTANLQANHDSLYASVTELSTQVRTLTDSHLDLHGAISRIDSRMDAITADLRVLLDRLPSSGG